MTARHRLTSLPVTALPISFATFLLTADANGQEHTSLLANGSFEQVIRSPGVPQEGGKRGSWTLHGGPSAPAEWTLSGYFGGELTVLSEGACDGERFLRIKAAAEREAHVHAACSGVRPDRHYRASLRYRGGPVRIKAYEYSPKGGAPHIETIATGLATAELKGEWATVEGEYSPYGIVNARVVAAVQTGCTADIDDFRVWQVKYDAPLDSTGWLNVRHYGASGSAFETVAETTVSSSQVTVKNVGDFKVGQGVMISKCRPRYAGLSLRGPESYYRGSKPAHGVIELRGFDGSGGDWLVFVLDIDGGKPLSFRWSDDLARSWKGRGVPITWGWQKLSGGLEVRFLKRDLKLGHGVTFSARTQLITKILKIEGDTLWLQHAATKSVKDAVVRHCDAAALQSVIKRAIRTRHNVYVPKGHYRLEHGLTVSNGSLRIEGASGVHTAMDISDGGGSVFRLHRGTEVTVRNFRMLGHTGFKDKPGTMRNATGNPFWCCALKPCNAVSINGTERVLCENVHAYRMASEAFYCQGPGRTSTTEPTTHTKSLTFRRCSVTDCAANAFNNNDVSENTVVEYCRIDGAAWHAYEGPGRFIKLIGNYVRNAGPFTVGDMNHRLEDLNKLGCGQAIIANNVFEGIGRCGGIALHHGPSQVTVSNNLFINYRGNAITVSGLTTRRSFPTKRVVVTGNIIDLTCNDKKPPWRTGIKVGAEGVIVSNNQIHVRGKPDPRTNGIYIREPAIDVTVHNNLIRNCGYGIITKRAQSGVKEVFADGSFLETSLPLEWHLSHRYRGWNLAWLSGPKIHSISTIESFDADTCRLGLAEPADIKPGYRFEIFPPSANWSIHSNTVTGCTRPVFLDSYGSPTSVLKGNIVTRGMAEGVKEAVAVMGQFKLIGNHISGFNEPDSGALALHPCRTGRQLRNLYVDNILSNCSRSVQERREGLWKASIRRGNLFTDCDRKTEVIAASAAQAPSRLVLRAPKLAGVVAVDGNVAEWPWNDKTRVITLDVDPAGHRVDAAKGLVLAAHDDGALYLAMRFLLPKGTKPQAGGRWGQGDGVEVSFMSADPKRPTPIFLLWGRADGTFESGPYGGASPEQVKRLQQETRYAARQTKGGWACEWRIPFEAMELKPADVKALRFNAVAHCPAANTWVAWVATGAQLYLVDQAGELRFED